jgi:hypothetical protein
MIADSMPSTEGIKWRQMMSWPTLFARIKLLFGAFWKLFRLCDEFTKKVQMTSICTIKVHYDARVPVAHYFDA